ncbi:DUF6602 domain-containing protein [Chitinibacter sp. GC72]|uniref:DUF6602 domain-containing protein n=1 Tax=Chitinibacter sp. GC72 TaxID=1526917 RepID=UPI0012F9FFCD|nr:DUF6602 domain-containing protein [Chitinibacter sp. GC72]
MAQNFFDRLRDYYKKVAEVLRGEAEAASVFANTTDIGISRELAYAEFLKQHAPSKCNVFLGGFLFDQDGAESKQLDIIITTDTTPSFNFHNKDGSGKSFSPVEGTLGVVSVKSTLNRAELFDALGGLASIPPTRDLGRRVNPSLKLRNYDDWPMKIVYATSGIAPNTVLMHLNEYYVTHPEIPLSRRPDFIHVAGSYFIARIKEDMNMHQLNTGSYEAPNMGTYHLITTDSDVQAIVWTLYRLQVYASASTHIHFQYDFIINKINCLD